MTMTMQAARDALNNVPPQFRNDNTVQDALARLLENLELAGERRGDPDDLAPSYVVKAVEGLNSWVEHSKASMVREAAAAEPEFNVRDMGICITPGPMVTPFETTLGDFLDRNPELAEEEAAIVDALTDGRGYHFGGGASPEYTISIPSA